MSLAIFPAHVEHFKTTVKEFIRAQWYTPVVLALGSRGKAEAEKVL